MFKFFVIFACLLAPLPQISSEPLFLTPFIKKGRIEEAQRRARVQPFLSKVKSYSGYLTVDEKYDSNLFFWFFPSKSSDWTRAPLVLWLQGGPGSSSLFGLFAENGPYVFRKGKLSHRRHSWTNFCNMLYVDNPVGTGFSFTNSSEGYATNQTAVGENLHEALRQFLLLFPQMQNTKLILSGESYAGKYVPSLAYAILLKNCTKPKINVYGLFVGNPMISAEDMLPHYSSYLMAHGVLDRRAGETMRRREQLILTHVYSKRWLQAGELFQNTFFDGYAKGATLLQQLTGLQNHYHALRDEIKLTQEYEKFLNEKRTRAALHVRSEKFGATDWTVYEKPTKPIFGVVLENFKTVLFFGQFDIICPYNLQLRVSENLDWSGNVAYRRASRQPLRWKKSLCGYYKSAANYTEVMVRNSGHFVPTDRPLWALGLLRKFADGDFNYYSASGSDISF